MNKKGINVLSLFDGMSGGQQALKELGIPVNNYYASEIDEYAIKVTQSNFPKTIQLGDVNKLDINYLKTLDIDLMLYGAPCQGYSTAGLRLNFDDPRSQLLFVATDIRNALQPKWWLAENVKMSQKILSAVNEYLGVEGVEINSSKFTPAYRHRTYWTNLKVEKSKLLSYKEKSIEDLFQFNGSESYTYLKNISDYHFVRGENTSDSNLKYLGGIVTKNSTLFLDNGKTLSRNFRQGYRVYSAKGIAPTLTASGGGLAGQTALICFQEDAEEPLKFTRRLSQQEAEVLQGFPRGYTEVVARTHALSMLGNGWNVPTIKFLLGDLHNKISK